MTVLAFDGFDTYDGTNATVANGGWTLTGAVTYNQTGRFTGSRAIFINSPSNFITRAHGSALSTVSVGFAFNPSTLVNMGTTGADLLVFKNGATVIAKLGVTSTGLLVTGRGDFTTNKIADSGAVLVSAVTWAYIEVEFTRSATVGAFNVYVNGTVVISSTGVNTGASDVDSSSLLGASSTNNSFDDFYLTNTATRLGERRVEYIVPTADTAQKDWGTSTGTVHFSLVDEIPNNGDTDYVVDSVVGHKDTYDLANLSSTPTTIDGARVILVARKDDATTRQIRNYNVSGATTTSGTTQTMGSSYSAFSDTYLTDPNTGAAWTAAAVNALQLGLEVVT